MIEPLLEAERLLLYGLLDQAEAIYRRAAEEDPSDPVAVLGLARVAVERGDEREAYRLATDAARLDPGNEAAAAMAKRLGELLARRGEPIGEAVAQKRRGVLGRLLRR